jgi:hypothetical protein
MEMRFILALSALASVCAFTVGFAPEAPSGTPENETPDPVRRAPPPTLERPRGRNRDLVARQRARHAASAAATTAAMAPEPQEQTSQPEVTPYEVFAIWAQELIEATGNPNDSASNMEIFRSYTGCCRSNNLPELEPEEFLRSLQQFSEPMGYLLVETSNGQWEMRNARLKG